MSRFFLLLALAACGAPEETIGESPETLQSCESVCNQQSKDCPKGPRLTTRSCDEGCRGIGEDADAKECGFEWTDYVTCVAGHLDDVCNEALYCQEDKMRWSICDNGL